VGYNTRVTESSEFWDFFWEVRLQALEDLGKGEAIRAASQEVRRRAQREDQPVRLLELGCGEGQIIGNLAAAHAQVRSMKASVGVDYASRAIEVCRRTYPGLKFIVGDFTDRVLLAGLGQFEILLLVNALHEVFSSVISPVTGEVDTPLAKEQVEQALAGAVERLAPGGTLVLFDGLEPPGDPQERLRIHFRDRLARRRFDLFVQEYRPFRICFQEVDGPTVVELSRRDFTRYITKSIFLGKSLWQTERLESYQYYTEAEFRQAASRVGLNICQLRTLTANYEKWRGEVEIETSGIDFPEEHILILANKTS
jgi:SAM-dependent methyltransferase